MHEFNGEKKHDNDLDITKQEIMKYLTLIKGYSNGLPTEEHMNSLFRGTPLLGLYKTLNL